MTDSLEDLLGKIVHTLRTNKEATVAFSDLAKKAKEDLVKSELAVNKLTKMLNDGVDPMADVYSIPELNEHLT